MHLTVGISTWNRAALLARSMQGFKGLRIPDGVSMEVIVCDNNSTDTTKTTVEDTARQLKGHLPVRYVLEPKQGSSHARNRLIQEATGEWILFLDDDVRVAPGWLEGYVRGMGQYPQAGVLGGQILPWIEWSIPHAKAFLIEHYPAVFGVCRLEKDTPMADPDPTAFGGNMAIRRDLLTAESFDPRLGMDGKQRVASEEVELMRSLLRAGHPGWLLKDAIVEHHIPRKAVALGPFCRWQMGIGRTWSIKRGRPQPGRFGIAWWAWREFTKRLLIAICRWRPWPTRRFYDSACNAAQYYGYIRFR